jgi:hypothetical protein
MEGANNRVFRVDLKDARALLKIYFQHPDDPRDRLKTEFSFSTFAWKNGVRSLPQPLVCDPSNHLGLYAFVQGRKVSPQEVTENLVQQALHFYCELNIPKRSPEAKILPKASEACFTLMDHLQCVERRLQNLWILDDSPKGKKSTALYRDATHFVQNNLTKVWESIASSVYKQALKLGLALESEIAQEDKCLSPSDFGFHNTILTNENRVFFLDFEYAGWDDPTKMICDFFCQQAVPVSMDNYDTFAETVVSNLSNPDLYFRRTTLLLPVHWLKWCCILLNDFLPLGSERRRFAGGTASSEEQKARQLEKARYALQNLGSVMINS